jgi:hypothetical protein
MRNLEGMKYMNVKRLSCASAVAFAIAAAGIAGLSAGAGVAGAQPGPPCQFGNCQGGPQQGPPRGPGGGPGGDGRDHNGPGGPGGPGGWNGPGRPGADGRDHNGPGGPGGWNGPGGWDGRGGPPPPPRDLAWRGIDQGRFDHQPFNYNGAWVNPIFNPDFNNWGFWFFGIWIPL